MVKKTPDLLDIFLDIYDSKNPLVTMEFIRSNFLTIVLAGIDTSSHVAAMALYNIAKNSTIKYYNI